MGTVIESDNKRAGYYLPRDQSQHGRAAAQYLAGRATAAMPAQVNYRMLAVLQTKPACEDAVAQDGWQVELHRLAMLTIPNTSEAEAKPMIAYLRSQLCTSKQTETNRNLLDLMEALSTRDAVAVELAAKKILANANVLRNESKGYALNALLLSLYQQQKWVEIQKLFDTLPGNRSVLASIIESHAYLHLKKK